MHLFVRLIFWYSAAVAQSLQGKTCVFRDALLHTTVATHGYLSYFCLPVSLNQSGHFPLISLINNAFLPTELYVYCIYHIKNSQMLNMGINFTLLYIKIQEFSIHLIVVCLIPHKMV